MIKTVYEGEKSTFGFIVPFATLNSKTVRPQNLRTTRITGKRVFSIVRHRLRVCVRYRFFTRKNKPIKINRPIKIVIFVFNSQRAHRHHLRDLFPRHTRIQLDLKRLKRVTLFKRLKPPTAL